MERLPYIDEHAITIDATRDDTWSALLRVMCRDPHDPSPVPFGFVLDEARPPERFALKGRHPFAVYRWVFELDALDSARTRLRAATWADFPGLHGKAYRALVIGTGGHRVVVRRTLKRVAAAVLDDRTQTGETAADYVDVFEVPISAGDVRTAEQAFRDGLGDMPGAGGRLVLWIHRNVLRLRLGPPRSPDHLIGWPIVRSDPDELVLSTRGPLMRGELTLRRQDGRRAVLTTRLHYRHRIAARAVWALIGPLHRAVAPRLMQRSAHKGGALAEIS
ncbi:hypothetical protein MMAN_34400 [Mycobacterium mantenii]|uniref:DUF2867 domain-containing protein n=1 Tax=Mycobacterium mantenii TaxID=560555 RepID=A0A1X0FWK5_MYCNT|nr:DUF2867 domain-containing protein [Mycobacterium mantenii]MCV7244417.1 DUF2867 domain-containing protein [Mycobacterium mantenii]ORB06162.1 hypothetical protein BST30_11385 [Mycobacterium mantenii]BBY39306.1 hypothetical protein MMAN_34400 [Mycobacterium mantenii]